jgi:Concanavalin A-like lectin/glucanases superfamily
MEEESDMQTRFLAVLTGAALGIALAVPVIEPAAAARRPPNGTRLLLTFDSRESLKAGTLVRDRSGFRHPGRIMTRRGGSLRPVNGWFRRGAGFPCVGCGRAIIEVADGKGLDPRRRPFLFGAAVRLGPGRALAASSVMQKGYYNQDGGQYKLQLRPGGAPSCVVFGAKGRLIVDAPATIADKAWHRVSCLRTPTSVRLRVDGKRVAAAHGATGLINNSQPVRLGGKKVAAPNKQYHGALDSAFLRLLPPVA